MALLVVPVSAGMVALALPAMRLVSFGSAARTGPQLLAAGVASLALGLYPYSAFLLFARSYYAMGDSRTPAFVAIGSALLGVATMIVLSQETHGAARVAALGLGHSAAYLVGALVLGVGCARRTGRSIVPVMLPVALGIGGAIAFGAWLVLRAVDPQGRLETIGWLVVVGAAGTAAYVLAARRWWRTSDLTPAEA
jgi:putative peptidoglycan lipid II flippase